MVRNVGKLELTRPFHIANEHVGKNMLQAYTQLNNFGLAMVKRYDKPTS